MELKKAKEIVAKLLSYKMYTCREVYQRLIQKGISEDIAELAVGEFCRAGVLDDEEYASIKIPITINEFEKLLYSSKTGEIYIQKQNTDGTKENLWRKEYIDITKQNIFKLPIRSIRNKTNSRR